MPFNFKVEQTKQTTGISRVSLYFAKAGAVATALKRVAAFAIVTLRILYLAAVSIFTLRD